MSPPTSVSVDSDVQVESKPLLDPGVSAMASAIEAVLVTAGRAVSPHRLAVALGLERPDALEGTDATQPAEPNASKRNRRNKSEPAPAEQIKVAVESLNAAYEQTGRAFRIEAVAGGYRLMTLPAHASAVKAYHGVGAAQRLSKAAVETLAIVAYKQPITRAHIETIRGVACGDVLKTLMDRRLVTIAGRAEELGRPLLYATSKQFLEAFGLSTLKDLPSVAELGLRPGAAAEPA